MSNARIQQIVTLLYMHDRLVGSTGILNGESEKLQELTDRMYKNISYYDDNDLICGSFGFLKLVINSWFQKR